MRARRLRDSLIRTVRVVESRLGSLASSYDVLQPGFVPQGGDGLTTYVITDAGRGRLITLLEELASAGSARFDRSAAAELARDLLINEYGFSEAALVPTGYAGERYQRDGIALLPYGSTDLFLSAKAALVAGSKVDVDQLRYAFREWARQRGRAARTTHRRARRARRDRGRRPRTAACDRPRDAHDPRAAVAWPWPCRRR